MTRAPFGSTRSGTPVERITLNNGAMRASVLTYGATLQSLYLDGLDRSLTLGSPDLAGYASGAFGYFGTIVGPVANRIGGATTRFRGRRLDFEPNDAGVNHLHGGSTGLGGKVWQVEAATDTRLLLSCTAADGEGGLPGNRRFEAEFTLGDGLDLTLALRATSDAATLANLCNHSYWNLSGNPTFDGHTLQVAARAYLPTDATALPTGEVRPVDGTPLDFRAARVLSPADVFDTNLCLAEARRTLAPAATLTAPDGLAMTLETTEPGLQLYDARHMPVSGAEGLDGRPCGPRCGIALEAQGWPDAPNKPGFPSIELEAGETSEQVTRFHFSRP
ncbi:aldose epimerase family protein [Tropicimonas sediminicola]|uniref:Aldose 1-epimerase n=1 Tax=Tropicimonas sediminicola TaxID=1031541 RepID=A0A239LWA6_9RHOB|nr:aldose epimerase family protein [Tropicimonas sediminicola]SNT34655.1 aldose 1-epimerase [Tropicimonas sediminicola]